MILKMMVGGGSRMLISENSFVVVAPPFPLLRRKKPGVPENLGDFWPMPFWLSLMSFAFLNLYRSSVSLFEDALLYQEDDDSLLYEKCVQIDSSPS